MALLDFLFRKAENRGLENPQVPLSSVEVLRHFGMDPAASTATVSIDSALSIPALWGAVNFLSGTLAGLPLNVFRKDGESGRKRVTGALQDILHDAPNAETSSFDWRKYFFDRVFTTGRGLSYLEFGGNNKLVGIWSIDPEKTLVRRREGRTEYVLREGRKSIVYGADEVLDVAFYLKADGLTAKSPIMSCADAISMAISATQYGAKFFNGGGIPPYVLMGPFTTPGGLARSSEEMKAAIDAAVRAGKPYTSLPNGHEIKPIGIDPEKAQMVDAQVFLIQQVARIYSLPPVFLQDLSRGNFANTEQQDLHLVKHTIKRWAEQFEQQLNLKLFGRGSSQYVEMNLDGLLRGDFKTRMEGYAQAIQNGVMKPNEARALENRSNETAGESLYAQSQLMPLGAASVTQQGDPNAA